MKENILNPNDFVDKVFKKTQNDFRNYLEDPYVPKWYKKSIDTYTIFLAFRVDKFSENEKKGILQSCTKDDFETFEKILLDGAKNWKQYSEGGCAFVYDDDIRQYCLPPYKVEERNDIIEMCEAANDWELLDEFDEEYDLLDLQAQFLEDASLIYFNILKETINNK